MGRPIRGLIFNIQRYSIHDGPGIRTVVFTKGCPLRCLWCSNPEGQSMYIELGYIKARCIGVEKCKAKCVQACPFNALSIGAKNGEKITVEVDRSKCNICGRCTEACLWNALKVVGSWVKVDEVIKEAERDRLFYDLSGGGVTISGGEPLLQPEFTKAIATRCREINIHVAIETCGHAEYSVLKSVLDCFDLIYIDIKHMDPVKHKELTGVTNELILENIRELLLSEDYRRRVIVRVPIIPGYNDDPENISTTMQFISESGGRRIELLPYHRFGISKYEQYGREYKLKAVLPPSNEHVGKLRNLARKYGLEEMSEKL